MDEVLKKLLNEKVLNEDTAKAIKGAFQTALNEAKAEQEAAIRAELAKQYENDKQAMQEALGKFLEQELKEHVAEFRDGVEEVNKIKAQYAKKTAQVKESAQKYVQSRLGAMEQAIEAIIKKEVSELHESEVANRRAYLKAINEKTAELEAEKAKFRKKAAAVLEHIINVKVSSTLDELKEDIQAARKADFGRELFESFYTTFRRQFFNSNQEFRAVTKRLKEAEQKAQSMESLAKKKISEAEKKAQTAEAARKKLEESVARKQKMDRLLSGLSGQARIQMKTILESSKTKDLDANFKKFIPEVLKETKKTKAAPKKNKLAEAVVELRTGGNERAITEADAADDDEIIDIRRRAGNE